MTRRLAIEVGVERARRLETCALCRERLRPGEWVIVIFSRHPFGLVRHAANHRRCPHRRNLRLVSAAA